MRWKLFDHAAHLGGALFGLCVTCVIHYCTLRCYNFFFFLGFGVIGGKKRYGVVECTFCKYGTNSEQEPDQTNKDVYITLCLFFRKQKQKQILNRNITRIQKRSLNE